MDFSVPDVYFRLIGQFVLIFENPFCHDLKVKIFFLLSNTYCQKKINTTGVLGISVYISIKFPLSPTLQQILLSGKTMTNHTIMNCGSHFHRWNYMSKISVCRNFSVIRFCYIFCCNSVICLKFEMS